jgi:cysteine synthase A
VVSKIVEQAEQRGELQPGMILLEGTTGNTGIATCMVGASKGYPVIIVMPEGMSEERKKTILAYGAELILTPGAETDVDLVLEEVASSTARKTSMPTTIIPAQKYGSKLREKLMGS